MLSGYKVRMWSMWVTLITFIPYTQTAHKIQTSGNHPKERIQYSKHGESLKSRTISFLSKSGIRYIFFQNKHNVILEKDSKHLH